MKRIFSLLLILFSINFSAIAQRLARGCTYICIVAVAPRPVLFLSSGRCRRGGGGGADSHRKIPCFCEKLRNGLPKSGRFPGKTPEKGRKNGWKRGDLKNYLPDSQREAKKWKKIFEIVLHEWKKQYFCNPVLRVTRTARVREDALRVSGRGEGETGTVLWMNGMM